jgi:hypothetical protein
MLKVEVSMADSLADRLNQRQAARRHAEQTEQDKINYQQRVNAFLSDNARPEYERMMTNLKKRVEDVNAGLRDLPHFQLGGGMVTQDNCIASWYFEKPIMNAPANRLTVGIGTHPNAMYFLTPRPDPERYQFQAAANDSLDGIIWVGRAGEFTSDALIDFALERLTSYYLVNKPGR